MRTLLLACLIALPISVARAADDIAYLAYSNGFWQVWLMDNKGKHNRQLTRSQYDKNRMSWYPDGENLLVNGLQGQLKKTSIKDGHEISINTKLKGMNDAVLSPDGKHIVFSLGTSNSRNDNNLWMVNNKGKEQQKITNMSQLQHEPVWTVDSQWIYFLSGDGGQAHDIWRYNVKNKMKEQLTVGQLYHFDVAISAQGKIAFSSNRSGNYEIWAQLGDKKYQQLTQHSALDGRPSWSPSGMQLMFESTRADSTPNLWRYDLPTKKVTQITFSKDGARFPVWRGR